MTWRVSYWDQDADRHVVVWVDTHEKALRKQAWAKARGYSNVQIEHKSKTHR